MPSSITTGRTTLLNDSRANTFVHTTTIRPGFEPPPEKHQFSWGLKGIMGRKRDANPSNKRAANSAKRHGQGRRAEPEPDPIPVRAALKFQIKTMEEPAATDSVTRLSTRVTPNSRPMYSVEDYPAPVAPKGYSRPAQDENENFKPLRFGERMLRNTAVCVAILLCALAIKTVDAPIARTVSSELRDWVTMDLDESLGSLKFVQNLLPDAALVFWHIGTQQTFSPPSQAALSHSWNENEPYLAYASSTQNPVYASAAGEVTAITYLDDSTITVRLRHEDGMETVYGNLASCTIREGDLVAISDVIGASDTLYFEIRDEGRSMNPAPLMAARQP